MREALSVGSILLRFGLRAALAKILNQSQGWLIKAIGYFALLYMPLLILYTNVRIFKDLSDAGKFYQRLTEWKLLPCQSSSCTALIEASQAWPAVPQLVWLAMGLTFLSMFLGSIFILTTFTKPESIDRDMEWMGLFPVPIRAVLWGRLFQTAVFHPFLLFYFLPFLVVPIYLRGTQLAWSIPSALLLGWMTTLVGLSISMSINHFFLFGIEKRRHKNLLSLISVPIFGAIFLVYLGFMLEVEIFWRTMFEVGQRLDESGILGFMDTFLGQNFPGVLPLIILVGGAVLVAHGNVLLAEKFMRRGAPAQERQNNSQSQGLTQLLDTLPFMMSWDLLRSLRNSGQLTFFLVGPLFFVVLMFFGLNSGNSYPSGSLILGTLLVLLLIFKGGRVANQWAADKSVQWLYASTPWRLSELLNQRRKFSWLLDVVILFLGLAILTSWEEFKDPSFLARIAACCLFIGLHELHLRSYALSFFSSDMKLNERPAGLVFFVGLVPAFVFILVNSEAWTAGAFFLVFAGLVLSYRQKVLHYEDQLLDSSFRLPATADLSSGFAAALTYTILLMISSGLSTIFRASLLSSTAAMVVAVAVLAGLHVSYFIRKTSDVPRYLGSIRGFDVVLLLGLGALVTAGIKVWDSPVTPSLLSLGFIIAARSVTEEFLFRGLIQRGLHTHVGTVLSVILSAILTTFCYEPQDFGPVFLASLAAGILYHRTKVLWPGILLVISVHLLRAYGF